MSFPSDDAFEVAMHLGGALEDGQIPYAIGGRITAEPPVPARHDG